MGALQHRAIRRRSHECNHIRRIRGRPESRSPDGNACSQGTLSQSHCREWPRVARELRAGSRGTIEEVSGPAAWDIEGAGFDQAHWNDGSGNFDRMLARLQQLDPKKEKFKLNQVRDILIAETAIKKGAILVSGDSTLRQVVSEFGGHAIDLPSL